MEKTAHKLAQFCPGLNCISCLVREMLPAIEVTQRTSYIYKKLYICKKKKGI